MTKAVWHYEQDQRMGCRKEGGLQEKRRGTKWKRGRVREMDEVRRWGSDERGFYGSDTRQVRDEIACAWYQKKKKKGQKGRNVVMVKKVIDEAKSEVGRGNRAEGEVWDTREKRWTHLTLELDTINRELDYRWVQMTWNRKQRLEKLWVEFRTMEESERGVIGIYVQRMGVLLYTHTGMEAWRGICC